MSKHINGNIVFWHKNVKPKQKWKMTKKIISSNSKKSELSVLMVREREDG